MISRILLTLGVGGIAAVALVVLGCSRQLGVKSHGMPVGRVVRAGGYLAVLIETRDPFMPSLKGRSESDMSYSYALWLLPESGDRKHETIELARGIASNKRMHSPGVRQPDKGTLWLAIDDLYGIDLASGRKVATPPPPSIANTPISQLLPSNEPPLEQYRTSSVTLPSGKMLALATEDEAKSEFKPGKQLYDNPTASGTYLNRGLYTIAAQPSRVRRVAAATRIPGVDLRNAAFMRSTPSGDVVRFSSPDGFLVVYEAGDPVARSWHFARVNTDGSVAWTADTKVGRLTQVLPHGEMPAFVGELPQQLTEPMIAVLHLKDGAVNTTSLKGPTN